jgi:hypothetical protein
MALRGVSNKDLMFEGQEMGRGLQTRELFLMDRRKEQSKE